MNMNMVTKITDQIIYFRNKLKLEIFFVVFHEYIYGDRWLVSAALGYDKIITVNLIWC